MSADDVLAQFRDAAGDDLATLLMGASRAVSAAVLAELDPRGESGVRLAHVPVIAVLDGGGSRLVDLAHGIGITRQATTALVRDLEQAGIVATTEDPRDRRATLVHLTDAGVAFCQQVLRVLERRERELASRIGAESLAELKATLRSLASPPS